MARRSACRRRCVVDAYGVCTRCFNEKPGADNPHVGRRLTYADATEMRALHRDGVPLADLARGWGRAPGYVSNVLRGHAHRHPPLPHPPKPAACRHCGHPRVNRPRGLCYRCFYAPGVRDLYPATSRYALRGIGHAINPRRLPLPPEPTTAPPGSLAKVAVLELRALIGVSLWHPDDFAPCAGDAA